MIFILSKKKIKLYKRDELFKKFKSSKIAIINH